MLKEHMKPDDITDQILKRSQEAGKTYAFDEGHNENIPADMWFQESEEGLILFLVFYSQACRWSKCLSCNLPSKMSQKLIGRDPQKMLSSYAVVISVP